MTIDRDQAPIVYGEAGMNAVAVRDKLNESLKTTGANGGFPHLSVCDQNGNFIGYVKDVQTVTNELIRIILRPVGGHE